MNKKKIPYVLWFLIVAPWTYLIIEVILIEMKWGLDALNNYSGIVVMLILITVVFIPIVCGFTMSKILDKFGFVLEGEK